MRALFVVLLPLLGACSSECDDPTRINGTWAMFHAVQNLGEGGATVDDAYPTYEVIPNGWTRWEVIWTAAGTATLRVTDAAERQGDYGDAGEQSYVGTMASTEGNCNALRLDFAGDWQAASGSVHAFTYAADVTFTGSGLAGTFAYDDTWTGTRVDAEGAAQDVSGALTGATGSVQGVLQADGFDTGFAR